MSNRKVDTLCKYLNNLTNLGFTKEDDRILVVIREIEKELELTFNQTMSLPILPVKNPNEALVIAIKDVTGSIGQWENDRFNEYYQLALKEIKNSYTDVKEIFITHHTEAFEVKKDEFFKCKSLGGTIASSGIRKLIEHLDTNREVIVIQFSDGDNITSDCDRVLKLMNEEVLPNVKYFKYFESNSYNRHSTLIQSAYKHITKDNFSYLVAIHKDDSLKGIRFGQELDELEK